MTLDLQFALEVAVLVLIASMLSREIGISIAIVEILLGVAGGNLLNLEPTSWMLFLGACLFIDAVAYSHDH